MEVLGGTLWKACTVCQRQLDSAQKARYDLGLPLPGPARLSAVRAGNPLTARERVRDKELKRCRLLSCPARSRHLPTPAGTSSTPAARFLVALPPRRLEIGRASCRERG